MTGKGRNVHGIKPGTRVFAAQKADEETVYLFGVGTYDGDYPRPEELMLFTWTDQELKESLLRTDERHPPEEYAERLSRLVENPERREQKYRQLLEIRTAELAKPMEERVAELRKAMSENPRITLDNGSVVWGCQCWWGPEERLEGWVMGRKVEYVPVPGAAAEIPS